MRFVSFDEGEARLDWLALTDALAAGHDMPRAEVADSFLYRGADTLLNRAAWIDGLGLAVKAATIFPENTGLSVNGAVNLFSDRDGLLEAVIDFHLVTKWKTTGDSLLAARRLARPDSRRILIVGAGNVAASLRQAYGVAFPDAEFLIWNRTATKAAEIAAGDARMQVAKDLAEAVGASDIVTSATMARDSLLRGEWLRPGQHIDLIGAFRPDMREADDDVLARGRLFVDSRETTIGHIGEIQIPLDSGAITEADILADYYQLDQFTRAPEDITVFKNGGGAHLDLMTARHILTAVDG